MDKKEVLDKLLSIKFFFLVLVIFLKSLFFLKVSLSTISYENLYLTLFTLQDENRNDKKIFHIVLSFIVFSV